MCSCKVHLLLIVTVFVCLVFIVCRHPLSFPRGIPADPHFVVHARRISETFGSLFAVVFNGPTDTIQFGQSLQLALLSLHTSHLWYVPATHYDVIPRNAYMDGALFIARKGRAEPYPLYIPVVTIPLGIETSHVPHEDYMSAVNSIIDIIDTSTVFAGCVPNAYGLVFIVHPLHYFRVDIISPSFGIIAGNTTFY